MGINQMEGTPWHLERYSRKDGDERRHRSRCMYFRKSGAYCHKYGERCRGSAHCMEYKEGSNTPDINVVSAMKITKRKSSKEIIKRNDDERRFPVGSRVLHKTFGAGVVESVSDGRIKVKFDNGKESMFQLDFCLKKDLLIRVDK